MLNFAQFTSCSQKIVTKVTHLASHMYTQLITSIDFTVRSEPLSKDYSLRNYVYMSKN